MSQNSTYPLYFRHRGKCVKVLSPTEARWIILPPEAPVALRIPVPSPVQSFYPSAERLLEDIRNMEPSTAQEYQDFLFSFYQSVRQEAAELSKIRQELYEEGRLLL